MIAIGCHSNFSLFQEREGKQYPLAIASPKAIVANAKQKGYSSVALADVGSVSGIPEFISACKAAGIKPIIGAKFGEYTLLCKNKQAWLKLIRLTSVAHKNYKDKPILPQEYLPVEDGDFFVLEGVPPTYYLNEGDFDDYKTVLCSTLSSCTLNNFQKKLEGSPLLRLLEENTRYLPPARASEYDLIEDQCDIFKIGDRPQFPNIDIPKGMTYESYLTELCREGWRKKIQNIVPKHEQGVYADRVKYELSVLIGAGLAPYFLIVADFMNWGKNQGWVLGKARGSAAGSLVSYLLNITEIDPIPHGLIFERFYNAGRNTVDKVSFPDIDCDVPSDKRDLFIEYITKKYGQDKVAPIITFQTMQGRGAIKDVLRVNESVDFGTMNRITKGIPDKEKISDQLKTMEDSGHPPSILLWTLQNRPEALREWAFIGDDGAIHGDLANQFKQAIRLEGIKKASGKHAAGIVISKFALEETAPMAYDRKTGGQVVAIGKEELEQVDLIKFDVLGISTLTKLALAEQIIRTGIC